jgi:imidazolonepropionase-like amidohydrolase
MIFRKRRDRHSECGRRDPSSPHQGNAANLRDSIWSRRSVLERAVRFTIGASVLPTVWRDVGFDGTAIAVEPPMAAGRTDRKLSPPAPVALVGGTVHPIAGPSLPETTLVMADGRIAAIGKRPELPSGTRILDVTGRHLYPGLFDASTNLGLSEIGSLPETIDETEIGEINPHVRAIAAFNTASRSIPLARSSGVLFALSAPSGALLPGRSAIVRMDGETAADMAVVADAALHVEWPSMRAEAEWLADRPVAEQVAGNAQRLTVLKSAFEQAEAYSRARRNVGSRHPFDPRWEALLPALEKRQSVIVQAEELAEIRAAAAFCESRGLRMILLGGYDAPRCAALLRRREIAVIVAGTHRVPRRRSAPYDEAYTVPARLHEAAVKYCLSASESLGAARLGNLAAAAATASAYGLPAADALRAITLSPAEILGVADRLGSLAVGKEATLFVADGEPLRPETQVTAAFVGGREVVLDNPLSRRWRP